MDQKTLIDRAVSFVASEAALARKLGVTSGNVNDWHHNRRACPVKHLAAMAELIGAPNVAEVVGQVELARAGNPQSKARRGVVAIATGFGVSAAVLAAVAGEPLTTMYRTVNRLRRWLHLHPNVKRRLAGRSQGGGYRRPHHGLGASLLAA